MFVSGCFVRENVRIISNNLNASLIIIACDELSAWFCGFCPFWVEDRRSASGFSLGRLGTAVEENCAQSVIDDLKLPNTHDNCSTQSRLSLFFCNVLSSAFNLRRYNIVKWSVIVNWLLLSKLFKIWATRLFSLLKNRPVRIEGKHGFLNP